MMTPNFMILYVDDPLASGRFYAGLLGCQPIETSPTFVLFALPDGLMLGLWSRHTVKPAASAGGGGCEVVFRLEEDAGVDAAHEDWTRQGVEILQPPTRMDFGRTFVGLDPDGHRLRVFCPDVA